MENRNQHLLLTGLLCIACNAGNVWADKTSSVDAKTSSADQVIEPELQRRKLDAPKIDAQNFELGVYGGVLSIQDFGNNPVVGVSLAYHVTEDFFLEADYGRSEGDKTSFEKLSGGAELLSSSDREYSYYSASVGWNVLPGEVFFGSHYAFNSALYLIGGIGGTKFAGDSAFTVNFGVGYRMLLTDWLAWHIDARDYLFDRSIFGDSERSNNLELRTGISVFF
ncbi:MAG TPA: outer membrane beta-barrel domain-containing protein [Spongiibacteraceae bacterium]|nr:outer membrane beta-barrel domain-containing protein [Spongiibacteraceae bacterium]